MVESGSEHSGKITCRVALIASILLGIALGVRLFVLYQFPHVIFLHEADAVGYIQVAKNIVENHSIGKSYFPPFYPGLIAVFAHITGNYESGARMASTVMGSIAIVPFFLTYRMLFDTRTAIYAALIASFFGTFLDYSVQPLTQATYLGVMTTSVWAAMSFRRIQSGTYALLFGLASSCLYLTRPEGILFFLVTIPILVLSVLRDTRSAGKRLFLIALLVGSFALPSFLYVLHLHSVTGTWTFSGKVAVAAIGVDESLKLLPDGKTFGEVSTRTVSFSYLFPSFSAFIKLYAYNTGNFIRSARTVLPDYSTGVVGIGFLLLLFKWGASLYQRKWLEFLDYALFFSPLVTLAPIMAFNTIAASVGYIFPFFLIFIVCFAYAVRWIEVRIGYGIRRLNPAAGAVYKKYACLALVPVVYFAGISFFQYYQIVSSEEFRQMSQQQDFLLRQTGHWLKNSTGSKAVIMARWSNIGFYGDRAWVGLVNGSIEEVTGYAKRHAITHIVIDSGTVPHRRPQLENLLYPVIPQAGLTPVYAEEQNFTTVIIYRVD